MIMSASSNSSHISFQSASRSCGKFVRMQSKRAFKAGDDRSTSSSYACTCSGVGAGALLVWVRSPASEEFVLTINEVFRFAERHGSEYCPRQYQPSQFRSGIVEVDFASDMYTSISPNDGDDRGRRERSSIVKPAGSATPVDRVVLRFPLNVREVVVYRSQNQFSNMSFSFSIAPMKLIWAAGFENVPMAKRLRCVRWSFSLELADCPFEPRSSFQWQHSLHGIFEEVYMQAISSAMFQCQSSLNGYASPLN